MNVNGATPLLSMRGVSKSFGHVQVLSDVEFSLRAHEVHVLAGENGAGKSTLIKVLAGVHRDYGGVVEIDGREVRFREPNEAVEHGVAVIHQELSLVSPMSVTDNLYLGRPHTTAGFVRHRWQREETRRWLQQFDIDASPDDAVEDLPISTQQRLEIAKALSLRAKILVMDEPTSSLTAPEVDRLFELVSELRAAGVGIVYITHKMDEIERIADRITVLRDGRSIATAPAAEMPPSRLVELMVGRKVEQQFPEPTRRAEGARLEVRDLCVPPPDGHGVGVESVSLEVRRGEVLGIGGLQGSGASELLLGLFAARRRTGQVLLDGQPITARNPRESVAAGIALLTADRKTSGLVLPMSIEANTTLASIDRYSPGGWLRFGREREAAASHAEAMRLRADSLSQPVGSLSGGNQQKVALAKWLETNPKVLLLDEPTRGVDVAAKREIYELIDRWAASGMAVVLISTEMPELLALSDRILVMHRGKATALMRRGEATAESVLAAAMGSSPTC